METCVLSCRHITAVCLVEPLKIYELGVRRKLGQLNLHSH